VLAGWLAGWLAISGGQVTTSCSEESKLPTEESKLPTVESKLPTEESKLPTEESKHDIGLASTRSTHTLVGHNVDLKTDLTCKGSKQSGPPVLLLRTHIKYTGLMNLN
jgi:hypothetical protein